MANNRNAEIRLSETNVVIPRNVEYQFQYSIEKPVYNVNVRLDYEMSLLNPKVFRQKVSKDIWKRIDSLEVN